ncbi:MAG: hypothetical protein IJX71_03835, partial [Oscillospiraceae bacterium]|nr:hypothetical protein [Oscillospiraceae bacterium]
VGGLLCFDKCTNKKENREKVNLLSEILLHPCNARCSVDYCPLEHLAFAAAVFALYALRPGMQSLWCTHESVSILPARKSNLPSDQK